MKYEEKQKEEGITKEIIKMVEEIKNEKFLMQIWTILKRHIEKRGG